MCTYYYTRKVKYWPTPSNSAAPARVATLRAGGCRRILRFSTRSRPSQHSLQWRRSVFRGARTSFITDSRAPVVPKADGDDGHNNSTSDALGYCRRLLRIISAPRSLLFFEKSFLYFPRMPRNLRPFFIIITVALFFIFHIIIVVKYYYLRSRASLFVCAFVRSRPRSSRINTTTAG